MIDAAHYIELLTVLVLAVFVGFEVISKVPTTLHTPLMSATNAIHGIVLAGAIVIVARLFGAEHEPWRSRSSRSLPSRSARSTSSADLP